MKQLYFQLILQNKIEDKHVRQISPNLKMAVMWYYGDYDKLRVKIISKVVI